MERNRLSYKMTNRTFYSSVQMWSVAAFISIQSLENIMLIAGNKAFMGRKKKSMLLIYSGIGKWVRQSFNNIILCDI